MTQAVSNPATAIYCSSHSSPVDSPVGRNAGRDITPQQRGVLFVLHTSAVGNIIKETRDTTCECYDGHFANVSSGQCSKCSKDLEISESAEGCECANLGEHRLNPGFCFPADSCPAGCKAGFGSLSMHCIAPTIPQAVVTFTFAGLTRQQVLDLYDLQISMRWTLTGELGLVLAYIAWRGCCRGAKESSWMVTIHPFLWKYLILLSLLRLWQLLPDQQPPILQPPKPLTLTLSGIDAGTISDSKITSNSTSSVTSSVNNSDIIM